MSDKQLDLEISRVMKAPRAKVWRAFEDPKHLAQWWCPRPWVTEVRAFELRPGGAFHTYMTGPLPDGTQGTSDNPGCFLEVVRHERIVTTSLLVGGWRPARSWLDMTTIFTLSDVDGGTRLHALAMHLTPEETLKHKEMGFEHGWGIMLSQWEEFATSLPG